MVDQDFEDAYYWHVLFDVVCLMKQQGYDKVLDDIDTLLLRQNETSK